MLKTATNKSLVLID